MNLSIAKRIWLLIGITAVALAAVGGIGLIGTKNLQSSVLNINDKTLPRLAAFDDIRTQVFLIQVDASSHALSNQSYRKEPLDADITKIRKQIDLQFKQYEQLTTDDTDKQMLMKDRELYDAYMVQVDKLLNYSRSEENTFLRITLEKGVDPSSSKLRIALEKHQAYLREQASMEGKTSGAAAINASLFSGVTVLFGIIAVALFGSIIGRSIIKGLNSVQNTVSKIETDLNFTLRVPAESNDELGKMAAALNRLLERLQSNLNAIASCANKVSGASAYMTDASVQVANASEEQSTSAASVAASIEELTVSISHVGDSAGTTRGSTAQAGVLAENGRKVVEQTVADINAIAEAVKAASARIQELGVQSDKITAVVAVIREVADQTNLLALNAAIEAARAGEQGRGFAVVADEVRKLAERTAKSTHEITSMVESVRLGAKSAEEGMKLAVARVATGVARTDEISQSIKQIQESSVETVVMVNDISSAISEQATASTSIAQQIEKIAQMAEQCSESASGTAKSAKELDGHAAEMRKIVDAYTL